jgi:tyrosinase
MSKDDRQGFTDALQCLQALPSQLDPAGYPGVKTRYDEFVAVHINMTNVIHLNVCIWSLCWCKAD